MQQEKQGLGGRKGSLQQRKGRVDVELVELMLRGGDGGHPGPVVGGATEKVSFGEKGKLSESIKEWHGGTAILLLTSARHPHPSHRQMKGRVSAQATRSSGLPESSK